MRYEQRFECGELADTYANRLASARDDTLDDPDIQALRALLERFRDRWNAGEARRNKIERRFRPSPPAIELAFDAILDALPIERLDEILTECVEAEASQ